jgi:hypothetical protein
VTYAVHYQGWGHRIIHKNKKIPRKCMWYVYAYVCHISSAATLRVFHVFQSRYVTGTELSHKCYRVSICLAYDTGHHMSGICLAYARHMTLEGHMRGICQLYARYMPGICLAYDINSHARHMPSIYMAYDNNTGPHSGRSKYVYLVSSLVKLRCQQRSYRFRRPT